MARCNLCGRVIGNNENVYKREIYSGSRQSTNFGKRVSFGMSRYYSMKDVCAECAAHEDQSSSGSGIIGILILVVIIFIFIYLLLK